MIQRIQKEVLEKNDKHLKIKKHEDIISDTESLIQTSITSLIEAQISNKTELMQTQVFISFHSSNLMHNKLSQVSHGEKNENPR
jgi:hypothetical protein